MRYLQLGSQRIHVATIFVILLRITPDEAHLFCELIPVLEIAGTRRWRTTVLSTCALLYALQTNWMSDELVIVL